MPGAFVGGAFVMPSTYAPTAMFLRHVFVPQPVMGHTKVTHHCLDLEHIRLFPIPLTYAL